MRPADQVYEFMRDLVRRVDLEEIPLMHRHRLSQLLAPFIAKTGSVGNPIEILYQNSGILYHQYGNDPRNLLRGTIDATLDEMTQRVRGRRMFKEVGIGKASLLMKNYVRFGIWDLDRYEIPIKIDRHVLRISIANGVLEVHGRLRTDKAIRPLQELYRQVTRTERISAIDLDDATWAIGSRLCLHNDYTYCRQKCDLNCQTRPRARKKTAYIFPNEEMRTNMGQGTLFSVHQ